MRERETERKRENERDRNEMERENEEKEKVRRRREGGEKETLTGCLPKMWVNSTHKNPGLFLIVIIDKKTLE